MPEHRKSKNETVKELVERYRRLLEENLPEEPGTLEEIERITEEIGKEVKKDLESECAGWHGTGYVGPTVRCSCGGPIDPINQPDVVDPLPVSLGTCDLAAGDHKLTFEVIGRGAAKPSDSYQVYIDYVKLIQAQ